MNRGILYDYIENILSHLDAASATSVGTVNSAKWTKDFDIASEELYQAEDDLVCLLSNLDMLELNDLEELEIDDVDTDWLRPRLQEGLGCIQYAQGCLSQCWHLYFLWKNDYVDEEELEWEDYSEYWREQVEAETEDFRNNLYTADQVLTDCLVDV